MSASQFASFTMRLKDKFQQQRRHSEGMRSSRVVADTQPQHTPQPKGQEVCVLAEQQHVVVSSLQYLKAVVDRLGLERAGLGKLDLDRSVVGGLLGGASASVLEAVQALVRLEPLLLGSRSVSACLARLYLSLAQLIGWADGVMLQGGGGGDHDDDGGGGGSAVSVTTVIRALLDGVKELVRLSADGAEGPAPGPAPVSPVQSQAPTGGEGLSPPPKPAMLRPPELSPPALPPKKRQSLPGPAPCRVAIVAPIRREPEAKQELQFEDGTLKTRISSPPVLNAHCDDDPDYDFLCKDLSSSESLPPLPRRTHASAAGAGGSSSPHAFEFGPAYCSDVMAAETLSPPLSSPLSPSGTPPPLPQKKRHIAQYLQFCSSYDAPSAALFYQRPLTRQREQEAALQLANAHLDEDHHAPSAQAPPAPALPPKRRQKATDRERPRDTDSSLGPQQEELLLTEQKEILHRISMNLEEEEGPDVRAASPDILLVYATDTDGGAEQEEYCDAFLCTYRSFLSPNEVISKLQHRYRELRGGRPDQLSAANSAFQLLLRVVLQLCTTELDCHLLQLLTELVSSLLIGGELEKAKLLRSNILTKMEQRWQLIGSPQGLRPLASRGVAARPGTLLDFRSQDLAEQLTFLDSELFYKIELPELLLWSKEQNEEKSPNLTAFTQHFNNVSFWVRSVIILQEKPHDREKLLLKFLKVMKHLRKLNNFNSYLSILSALDSAPLRRLDWQRSTSEMLEESSSLIDSSSSFRAYRAALAEVEPPCIPYLGMILQDLTFVHLGNPDLLATSQGSRVNFSKRWQQFNILDTVRRYQNSRYCLQPDDDIISFFNDFSDHLAEEALWELSLKLRPKNTPRANH